MPDNIAYFFRNMANDRSRSSGGANFDYSNGKSVVSIAVLSFSFRKVAT